MVSLYSILKIIDSMKSPSILLRLCTLFVLCFTPILSYSADVAVAVPANKAAQQLETSAVTESEEESADSDEFCVIEAFSYVVDWVEKAIKRIDNEHFHPQPTDIIEETVTVPVPVETIKEEPKVVLDLTIPDVNYAGTMGIDKGQKLNFPDLFSEQAKKPYSKEAPSSSFGGRLLMDDAQLESMEEYRINTVREAVRGAEVSLEFKTN
jgi:hypothetical protein